MFLEIITSAYAQEAVASTSKQASFLSSIAPLLLIFTVFYFFLIRPQQKKMKDHQNLLGTLKKGDDVTTSSGILGSVVKIDAEKGLVELEIAKGVAIKIRRDSITEVANKTSAA